MAHREVPFSNGMKIGVGYDRLTGDVLPSAGAVGPSVSGVAQAGGQQVSSDCVIVQDVETLHKSLGVSVDAGGSYMGFSASAKVDYVSGCDFSSFSTYALVRVSVQNAFLSLDEPVLSPDAHQLVVNGDPERFRHRFGDTFISGIRTGGEYFAIYQLTSTSQSERETLAVQVHAAFNGGLTSAELNTAINTATERSQSHLAVQVHVFRQGTVSHADLGIDDIMRTAKTFPVDVSGERAFPYAVLLQDYSRLRQPNDQFNYLDIQNQQETLADLAKRRFEFLQLRDDYSYILKHLADFQNPDGSAVDRQKVAADQRAVIDAVNTMQQQAARCSRDASRCEFTAFDVGAFEKPVLKPGAPTPAGPLVTVPMWNTEEHALEGGTVTFATGDVFEPSAASLGLLLVFVRVASPFQGDDRGGIVLGQDPPAGALVPVGTTVTVTVSKPEPTPPSQ
ncbi:PASTA domain-containing protein [Longispora sp. NPDC051575]|uniref:PASTA domain-containing protein n=1 Tax=Longispora sp. NPDC051575 TaxID=3154943 RepID=UPI003439C6D6